VQLPNKYIHRGIDKIGLKAADFESKLPGERSWNPLLGSGVVLIKMFRSVPVLNG